MKPADCSLWLRIVSAEHKTRQASEAAHARLVRHAPRALMRREIGSRARAFERGYLTIASAEHKPRRASEAAHARLGTRPASRRRGIGSHAREFDG